MKSSRDCDFSCSIHDSSWILRFSGLGIERVVERQVRDKKGAPCRRRASRAIRPPIE